MDNQIENLDLTKEFQKEEIKLYSTILKEIFGALKSIQDYSIKEILKIASQGADNSDNKKIEKEINLINRIISDICSLLEAKKIDEVKNNIIEFGYSMHLYEDLYNCPNYDKEYIEWMEKGYAEQQKKEKEIEKERSRNKKLYGLDYANYHCLKKCEEIYGSIPSLRDIEEKIKKGEWGNSTASKALYETLVKRKNYDKYYIKANNPSFEMKKVSKRKLPTLIFEYLFVNGYMSDSDLDKYSTNQFGRTFETKRGDILTEEEMANNQKNLHRYNKIDFSKISNSKYNKTLYISNQWDYDSITKFIEHINEAYKGIIFADEEYSKEKAKNWK